MRAFTNPTTHVFPDDGVFPNSRLPAIVYSAALATLPERDPASAFEALFDRNGWGGSSWRNGLFQAHHYHSTAHEVLGVYTGRVRIHLGGPRGLVISLGAGDVVVIPAGVAHMNAGASADFRVVGAYPAGTSPDLNFGKRGERPQTDVNVARVALPTTDPVEGKAGPLLTHWRCKP
jgi:uncharacterized protein YjlB